MYKASSNGAPKPSHQQPRDQSAETKTQPKVDKQSKTDKL